MSERRVLKWNVPLNDQPHPIGGGEVKFVACQHGPESVQVWTEEDGSSKPRLAQVFGTGQPLPPEATHLGSALAANGALVWHVYEQVSA